MRTVALPLLTGGALAALVAYVYTRRARRLEMVRELVVGRDPLGIPKTVSDALERASEGVHVRSEAEAMAVSGVWTGNSADSPDDFYNRPLDPKSPILDASLNDAIFRVDEPATPALEDDDLRVPKAAGFRRTSESAQGTSPSDGKSHHESVDIDALAAGWRPPSPKANG